MRIIIDEGKQCQALKLNKKQCTRAARKDSKYCWQHRFSRSRDPHWYVNAKIQAYIALAAILLTVVGIVLAIRFARAGPTKSNQREILTQTGNLSENAQKNHQETQEKLDEIMARLDPAIPEDIKRAIENIFLGILREKDIPQWQWPEKLQEISKQHQELLAKWQTVQSGDPEVDKLRAKARRMIELGEYDKADQSLQDAIEIDRKAIQSQQENLDRRKLSMARSLASQAAIAKTKLEYNRAIDLYKKAMDALPEDQQTTQAAFLNNLGTLYHTVADYKEAEGLMKRVVEILITRDSHPILLLHSNSFIITRT